MKWSLLSIIIVVSFFSACSSGDTERPINPNGDSELSLVMRQMFEDGMIVKQGILENKEINTILKHEDILTSISTDPETAESDSYKAFASNYLQLMEKVNDENNPNRKAAYSDLVNSCIQCHKSLCPGPIVKIEKLILK